MPRRVLTRVQHSDDFVDKFEEVVRINSKLNFESPEVKTKIRNDKNNCCYAWVDYSRTGVREKRLRPFGSVQTYFIGTFTNAF